MNHKDEIFEPMINYIPKFLWEDLMFMGIHEDRIYLYKHYETRCYINVDKHGKFYYYIGNNNYQEIDRGLALENLQLQL